ncbi:MAG: M23 family metallopeptidase [Candidatus Dadabacteria bacterium]|nr:MAG: M23 family metallopeptidase [Candidatus Dadabacteria bacterium]
MSKGFIKDPKKDDSIGVVLIPTNSGRIKKLPIRKAPTYLFLSVCALALIAAAWCGFDYTRLLKARKSALLLFDKIYSSPSAPPYNGDSSLESKINYLILEHNKTAEYERQVKERLSVLNAILNAQGENSSFEPDEAVQQKGDIEGNVGGAEVECKKTDGIFCLPTMEEIKAGLKWDLTQNYPNKGSVPSTYAKSRFGLGGDLAAAVDRISSKLISLPLIMPADGWKTSGFGLRRSPFTKRVTKHQGIDISVPYRTPVVSTADGRVKRVVRSRAYGLMVDIDHGNGITTRYAHLLKVLVKRRQKVCRGQIIALSGSSGRSTGPHLHYEIRIAKKAVNPEAFLKLGDILKELGSAQ